MAAKSEIRDSDINSLLDNVDRNRIHKYLKKITLEKIRAYNNQEIRFDFPVTALIGPNGSGKTTILGAAGIAYRSVQPGQFFTKSGKYDESMSDWSINYEIYDREIAPNRSISRSANFKRARWNRDAIPRGVEIFGISRTLPATERNTLNKAKNSKFVAAKEEKLIDDIKRAGEQILGKDLSGYGQLEISENGEVIFQGENNGNKYSEFHFGAGEASILRIVSGIEKSEKYSLILIEEIENGLHPVATKRLIDYLIQKAIEKKIQVIFTTHSNDALKNLPDKAIWSSINGNLIQGRLNVEALRTISGQVDTKLAIYVEDDFAERLVAKILWKNKINNNAVQIHGVGGYSPVLKYNEMRHSDPASSFKSIAILDGDQSDKEDSSKHIYCLPGVGAPDTHIFEYIRNNIKENSARVCVMLGLDTTDQKMLQEAIETSARTNIDRHIIFAKVGERLNYLSEDIIKEIFITEWVNHSDGAREFFEKIKHEFSSLGLIESE